MHHPGGPPPPGMVPQQQWPPAQQMAHQNEHVWLQIGISTLCSEISTMLIDLSGSLAELMGNLDEAMGAYEHALRANSRSIPAMNAISCILRTQEHFHKAVEYLQNILKLEGNNGDVWGSLGMFSTLYCNCLTNMLVQATAI